MLPYIIPVEKQPINVRALSNFLFMDRLSIAFYFTIPFPQAAKDDELKSSKISKDFDYALP